MGSKTKIIVLHMKEIIYTAVFAALGILLIILLAVMFRPDGGTKETAALGNSILQVFIHPRSR